MSHTCRAQVWGRRRASIATPCLAAVAVALALAACDGGTPRAPQAGDAAATWRTPPMLVDARASGDGVTLTGRGAPGARVAVLSVDGPAHAAAVDDAGGFSLTLPSPSAPILYQLETQGGRERARAAGRLLLAPVGPGGLAVVLTPGEATQVLTRPSLLSAVDRDGREALASGRAGPGAEVRVRAGPADLSIRADAEGRWRALLPTADGDLLVRVDSGGRADQALVRPIDMAAGVDPEEAIVSPTDSGVVIVWRLPGGGVQTTWIAVDRNGSENRPGAVARSADTLL